MISTLVELGGFAALTIAAWRWNPTVGLVVLGAVLLLVGYALDDRAATVSLGRLSAPLSRRVAAAKQKRAAKKTSE